MGKIVAYRQLDGRDCGPTCLRIIANFYGRKVSLEKLLNLSETTREGSSIKNITDAAKLIGFKTMGVRISYDQLKSGIPLPCIIFWQQRHFVVVYKVKNDQIWIADPAHGKIKIHKNELIKNWIGHDADDQLKAGITLLLEPTEQLKTKEPDDVSDSLKLSFLWKYFFIHKRLLIQLFIGLLAGSLLQFLVPYLTQSVVDIGIQHNDIHFVYLVLIAQLGLFVGRVSIGLIRSWIILHLSTRINIALVSDFFIKLMNLPISFFDSKVTGDLMQRIKDHSKIQKLLTSASLDTFFSIVNILVFGLILAWYHIQIFYIFLVGSLLYFIWIYLFLKKRKDIDYKRFTQLGSEQGKMMELINGMQDIKLNNAELEKRWGWEYVQAKLFKIDLQNLVLQQSQTTGANIINELKNILITFFAAKLVIDGQLTLGMMIAVAYIIGYLNGPIQQLIGFVYTLQDARIALERLAQIHNKKDETQLDETKLKRITNNQEIAVKNISFRYHGALNKVFTDLSFTIPPNKITAIVGGSGSGKTTLLKLLLKFYSVSEGDLFYGDVQLDEIDQKAWRSHCGVVMQEGFM
ncbi:MAG: ATP-binding cassette domain-containing protein, partial [Crocinitomix sp.]|nr:ATP-binding cassette domain-containing protein [Crocinitomix sp.]